MEKVKYFDKNKKEIKVGMKIKHNDGDIEKVYACGDDDLGVNASNEVWLDRHYGEDKEAYREFYPLSQFSLKEWEIVED